MKTSHIVFATPMLIGASYYVIANDAPSDIKSWASAAQDTGSNVYVCDGTADDVQIQTALDFGSDVYLSKGTFNLAASLLPVANNRLYGAGMFQTLLVPQSALQGAIQVNVAGVTLSDFGINCNNVSLSGVRTSYTANASLCFIERLYVYNLSTADVGVAIQYFDINRGHVKDCHLLCSNGQGILASYGCQDVIISGNYIYNNKDNAIEMAGNHATAYPKRILVYGNIIDGQADANGRGIVVAENAEYITIGNNLVNGASYGIDLETAVAARTMKFIKVHGNKVWASYTYDIRVSTTQNDSEDVTITDNECLTSGKEYNETGTHTRLKVARNKGYVTENSGTGTINSGATSATITHGCSYTPTAKDITVTLTENPSNTPGAIWVDTITATQFNVNCENDPGASNLDFSWAVRRV